MCERSLLIHTDDRQTDSQTDRQTDREDCTVRKPISEPFIGFRKLLESKNCTKTLASPKKNFFHKVIWEK